MNLQNTTSTSPTPNGDLSDPASPTAPAEWTGPEEQVSYSILPLLPVVEVKPGPSPGQPMHRVGGDKLMPKY